MYYEECLEGFHNGCFSPLLARTMRGSFSDPCSEKWVEFLEWKVKKIWSPPMMIAQEFLTLMLIHSSGRNLSNLLALIVICVILSRYPLIWSNTSQYAALKLVFNVINI